MTIRFIQPSDWRQRVRQKGFTLLELLISMTLFLLVIVILGGALRLGFRSISAGEKRMDVLERFRSSFGIITNQLQSAVPLTYDERWGKKILSQGGRNNPAVRHRSIDLGKRNGVCHRILPIGTG